MGIFDIFKTSEYKKTIEEQNEKLRAQEAVLSDDQREAVDLQGLIAELKQSRADLEADIAKKREVLEETEVQLAQLNEQAIETQDDILLQSFGLYKPQYDFASSDIYKQELTKIRDAQKALIKEGRAATGSTDWTVNGSKSKGSKMVKDMQKLLLRAFNSECDEQVAKVKFNNFEMAEKRITQSREAISKLGTIMSVSISSAYYNLKIQELHLAHEYRLKKQEEKEEQQRIREEMREAAKLEKEIEEARKSIYKEQKHYQNALEKLRLQLSEVDDPDKLAALREKEAEIQAQLSDLDKNLEQVDYRAANQKAGYVYVISNIGAFGENVYKIGMTRRLDPYERISELGDASVPFTFDVHAMIFSEDAPKLEAALHRAFDRKKLNMINTRREFFNVSLDEIEQVVRDNYDKTVEFTRTAAAEQYRQSLLIKQSQTA